MNTDTPTLFIKKGCPYCTEAMEYLNEKGIAYEKSEVSNSDENMDELEEVSVQTTTPTLVFENDVLANFDVDDLDPFLAKHKLI